MGKYFGTDGVRGVANTGLTPELAFKIGRAGGYVLTKHHHARPKVLIGRDTRVSGHMLESALVAGLLSIGAEVMRLGVISTPGVAYLTKALDAQAGVMISASHNPVQDNGIKFFGPDGFKLSDDEELEIEQLLDATVDELPRPTGADVGVVSDYFEGSRKYLQYLKQTIDEDFSNIHVALDCAHGATSALAPHLFVDLDADVSTMGASPNGLNINEKVGSTHPEQLAAFVKEKGAQIGLAFDGDGDRLIVVDELGNILDGDQIMFVLARHLKSQGRLRSNMVVSTVMSNLGFYKALEQFGIESVQASVGDRYVMEEMKKGNYNLGGEQSGHIIMLDYIQTGDGMLSALQLVSAMKQTGKPLSALAKDMQKYPQLLVNVRVPSKQEVMDSPALKAIIAEVEQEMAGNGRVLVRPSGTEQLIRVMAEAPTKEQCEDGVYRIVNIVKEIAGILEA
ncbi:MAG: phosphoglucosamine mutase [Bacilli bacterium]